VEIQAWASFEVFVTITILFENPNLNSKKVVENQHCQNFKVIILGFQIKWPTFF
jgi:hypothetical protein